MDGRKNRLTLVDAPIDLDVIDLEPALIDLDARETADAVLSRDRRIPFSVWITMRQVLDVAEEAELRSALLALSSRRIPGSSDALRKVKTLHEASIDLRRIAARLGDSWREPVPR